MFSRLICKFVGDISAAAWLYLGKIKKKQKSLENHKSGISGKREEKLFGCGRL